MIKSISRNISRLREVSGLTLSGLSQRCGIAKSTLSQLEAGEGNPTIETLWAIANALNTPFSELISDSPAGAPVVDEASAVRFIERNGSGHAPTIEVYSMRVNAGHVKHSAPHPPGVTEKIIVTRGAMLVGEARQPRLISAGDTHSFTADVPHLYGTTGDVAEAIVFVQYPEICADALKGVAVLDWPTTPDWDGISSVIERLSTEVANGTGSALIRFRGCTLSPRQAQDLLKQNLRQVSAAGFLWPLQAFTGSDHSGPFIALLPLRFTHAFSREVPDLKLRSTIAEEAVYLARQAEATLDHPAAVPDETVSHESQSWVLEALRSEIALQRGELRLPAQLNPLSIRKRITTRAGADDSSFSSRIDVDQYDAFELLHPAYARQVVAMAQDISSLTPGTRSLINVDVGTGPGLPLLMLHEMLPSLNSLAVEPDAIAFACLQKNTQGQKDIRLCNADFLEQEFQQPVDLITSVGASHHFNTAFMLQKAKSILRPGGLLSIADEYLPEFDNAEQRQLGLIRHHAAYILSSIGMIESCVMAVPDDAEGQLFLKFKEELALAVNDAANGLTDLAVRRSRSLFTELRRTPPDRSPKNEIGAFTRFFWLELQAMVAGLDYEVERKTYARRFAALASAAGLELIQHRRVFATAGADDWSGGTHVFLFRRPTLC